MVIYEQFFKNFQPYTYIRTQLDQTGHKITVQASGRSIVSVDGTVFLYESMSIMLDDKHIKHNSVQKDMVGQSPVYLSIPCELELVWWHLFTLFKYNILFS
jgi:hypothetical protein